MTTAWHPISTAPKDGTPVLLASVRSGGWRLWASDGWHKKQNAWRGQGPRNPPSYWQPLPEPPSANVGPKEIIKGFTSLPSNTVPNPRFQK